MLNIKTMLIVLRNMYQNANNASSETLQKRSGASAPHAECCSEGPSGSRCRNNQSHSRRLWRHLIHISKCNVITFFYNSLVNGSLLHKLRAVSVCRFADV